MPKKPVQEVLIPFSPQEMDLLGLKNLNEAQRSDVTEQRLRAALGWPARNHEPQESPARDFH